MLSLLRHHRVKTHISQMWRFIVCGGIGFTLDLSSLTLLVERFDVNEYIAVILSSLIGASFVFVANKFFTFGNRESKYGSQVLKFLLVYGVSIAGNALIANALIWFGMYYLFAKIIAVGIGAAWNYALSHGFIFKKNEPVDVAVV